MEIIEWALTNKQIAACYTLPTHWTQTHYIFQQPEPESDDEYPYDDIMMGKLPKKKKREEPMDIPCFHRATSFDNTFQSDMAR